MELYVRTALGYLEYPVFAINIIVIINSREYIDLTLVWPGQSPPGRLLGGSGSRPPGRPPQ